MKNAPRLFATLALLILWSITTHASNVPEAMSATYALKKGIIEFGESTRTLKPLGNGQYTFESVTSATGMFSWILRGKIVERSTFNYTNGVVRPLEYFYEKVSGSKTRTVKLNFDWAKNTVVNTVNDDPWTMTLEPGVQDKLIYQISLMKDMAPGKRDYQYKVADGGSIKIYQVVMTGEEEVDTPYGKFATVKVTRVGDKRNTTLWCAPKLNYLPVKIEQSESDDGFTAILKSATGLPR